MGRKPNSNGIESEYHTVAVRLRVIGSGNLQLELSDLGSVSTDRLSITPTQTQNLIPIAMQASTRIEPTRLANFQSQRTCLTGFVNELDETFTINRIILFSKAVAVEYPS